jgi:hypothetical protein
MIAFEKYPLEAMPYELDFSNELGTGYAIASIVSVTASNMASYPYTDSTREVVASTPAPSIGPGIGGASTAVAFTLTGGNPSEQHLIAVDIVSSDGRNLTGECTLTILT